MIIHFGMFMRKILQYAILILFGLNSAYALSSPFSSCKPSLIRDVAKLLPKSKDGDVNFHKKVNTMNQCIGNNADTLRKKHADVAKTTASICSSDEKFAAKFPSQCKLAALANKPAAKKAKKPSMFSRMTGKKPTKKKSTKKKTTKKKSARVDDGMEDFDENDLLGDDAAEDVCSPQMQNPYGMPPAYGQAPYGMAPAYGQAPYGMPPAYGPQAPYGVDPSAPSSYAQSMYGAQPQYGSPAYGYQQPQQGVYQDPSMGGQMASPQSIYPQAPGVAPAYAGQIVNTPQGPVCSCPR